MVIFGNKAYTTFNLKDFRSKKEIINEVRKIPYKDNGNTNTTAGIYEVMENSFNIKSGYRMGENGVFQGVFIF